MISKIKSYGFSLICFVCCVFGLLFLTCSDTGVIAIFNKSTEAEASEYIKWMSFDVPVPVLAQALSYDINSYNQDLHFDWIELISYAAAKNWGKLGDKKSKDIDSLVEKLKNGEYLSDLTRDLKLYPFYLETYGAVLQNYVGLFEITEQDPNDPDKQITVTKYGLKAYSPIAKGYSYSHYDDFGVSRSYGYRRKHQGNDLMGRIGTPVIAVEDGYVEAMGWNQYGGWRIGIRSADGKRYYYYAHLRKDHPFHKSIKEGSYVKAGDVIGYLGMTGYSSKENVNNIRIPHLHFGLQIIFDESQKEGVNQIWIDVYNLVEFLGKNKMPVYKDEASGDYFRAVETTGVNME